MALTQEQIELIQSDNPSPFEEGAKEYYAWEKWMNAKEDAFAGSTFWPLFDVMETVEHIDLYAIMCELAGDSRPWLA